MDSLSSTAATELGRANRAAFAVRFGKRVGATGEVEVTGAGLLAIGGLVASVLLSTAVVVHAARRR